MATLPPNSRILVTTDQNGMVQQTGFANVPGRGVCPCNHIPNWQPCYPGQLGGQFQLLTPAEAASLQGQIAAGASRRGNTFSNVNIPNLGPVGLSNRQMPGSPSAGNQVFTIILDNTLGATMARKFLGDINGTYALLGNTELTPAGFVVGGTWLTNTLSQLIAMQGRRPWSVDKIQFIADVSTYFNTAVNNYFDTNPTRDSPTVDNLVLTNLLQPTNFNNTIQWYDKELYFDGVNGLDIQIPAGRSVTLQYTITAVGKATNQVRVS